MNYRSIVLWATGLGGITLAVVVGTQSRIDLWLKPTSNYGALPDSKSTVACDDATTNNLARQNFSKCITGSNNSLQPGNGMTVSVAPEDCSVEVQLKHFKVQISTDRQVSITRAIGIDDGTGDCINSKCQSFIEMVNGIDFFNETERLNFTYDRPDRREPTTPVKFLINLRTLKTNIDKKLQESCGGSYPNEQVLEGIAQCLEPAIKDLFHLSKCIGHLPGPPRKKEEGASPVPVR